MSDKLPPNLTAEGIDPGAAFIADLDQTPWRRLAEATTVEEFSGSWLELQCRMIGGVTGSVVVLERAGSDALAPVAFWPRGAWDRKRLTGVVERSLREKKGVLLRSDADSESDSPGDLRFHLAYTVWVGSKLHGVAAVQISPRPQIQLQSAMRQLQWGISWLQNWILRQVAAPEAHLRQRLVLPLELAALVLEEERFQGAATSFVTELATRLECDRASVGFLKGRQVKVHALSHSAQFGKQMNIIRSIGMAMSESLDQQALLVYPEPEGKSPHVLHAHEQLVRIHDDRAVCTVPFVDHEGRAFGAITLERSVPQPFDERTQEICDSVAALVGPILEEKRKNDRLLITKWVIS